MKTTSTSHGGTWQGGRELGGQVEARGGGQLLGLGAKESSTDKTMSTIIGLTMMDVVYGVYPHLAG